MTCSIIKRSLPMALFGREVNTFYCETHELLVQEGSSECWMGRYDTDVQRRIDEAVAKADVKIQAAVAEINDAMALQGAADVKV